MNRFKLMIALVIFLLPMQSLSYERFPIIFESSEHNFGEIQDDLGNVYYSFTFNVISNCKIFKVVTDCSCVSISYPREELQAGSKQSINISLNPIGLSGTISRNIDIYISNEEEIGTLTISADVISSSHAFEDMFGFSYPEGLKLSFTDVRFGYIKAGGYAIKEIEVKNTSTSRLRLGVEKLSTNKFLMTSLPLYLEAGERGLLAIKYAFLDKESNCIGKYVDSLQLVINGRACDKLIHVSSICLPVVNIVSGSAPTLTTYPSHPKSKKHFFKDTWYSSITISNTGNADLVIFKVDSTNTNVNVDIDSNVIKPGTSVNVEIVSERSDCTIGIISNDPIRPYKEIKIH